MIVKHTRRAPADAGRDAKRDQARDAHATALTPRRWTPPMPAHAHG